MLILTSNLGAPQKAEDILLPKAQRLLAVLSIHLLLPGATATHSCPLVSLISLKHSPCLTPWGELISNSEQPHPGHQADRCLPPGPESANERRTVDIVRTRNRASQWLEQWTARTKLPLWGLVLQDLVPYLYRAGRVIFFSWLMKCEQHKQSA